jgi:Zn-finger nucleic acid-binding protein
MDCPKCVGKLEEVKIGEKKPLVIDRCFACGGLWFDKDELAIAINKEILDTEEFALEEEPIKDNKLKSEVDLDKKQATCPRCKGNKIMVKIPSRRNKNVIMDYCESCQGIWLDASEYKKISQRTLLELELEKIIDFFRFHFPHIFKDAR